MRGSYVSSVPAGMSQLAKSAMLARRTSCESTNTDCFSMLGAHEWLKKRPTFPHLATQRGVFIVIIIYILFVFIFIFFLGGEGGLNEF